MASDVGLEIDYPNDNDTPQAQQKMTPDIQRYLLDTEPLRLIFYQAFCGWVETPDTQNIDMLGAKIQQTRKIYVVEKNARLLNEAGANYLYNSIKPLIDATTASSNLTRGQIYRLWHAKLLTISFSLLDSIMFEGNPYEIKNIERIADIISTLTAFSGITYKAKDGFTMSKLADTFISTFIQRTSGATPQASLLDKIKGAIPKI